MPALVLLAALVFVPQQDGAAAWNRFRGPNGTGIAASGSYLAEIGPEEHVLWKCALPPGRSSPVLSRAQVFVTACNFVEAALQRGHIERAGNAPAEIAVVGREAGVDLIENPQLLLRK